MLEFTLVKSGLTVYIDPSAIAAVVQRERRTRYASGPIGTAVIVLFSGDKVQVLDDDRLAGITVSNEKGLLAIKEGSDG